MARRVGPRAKFVALVPLAVVSAACTIDLCTAPVAAPAAVLSLSSSIAPGSQLPVTDGTDGTATAPTGVLPPVYQPPVSLAGSPLTPASGAGGAATPASSVVDATADIPAVALAAYQRAATVMGAADSSCHLSWQLLAAIGRVESDHGQAQGNTLSASGIASPGIFGPVLNGKHGTTKVADTDGGALDGNKQFDRALGPMQFIPSTWSAVSVDADGDGKRDPQDINDAALGAAAYLCANHADLSTPQGERQAVFRYNHSWTYVHTVLTLAQDYTDGQGIPADPALDLGPVGPVGTVGAVATRPVRGGTGATPGGAQATPGVRLSGSQTTAGEPAVITTLPAAPSTPSKPSTPPPSDPGTPAPKPADNAQLTDLCTNGTDTIDGIVATFPDAPAQALSDAEAQCVVQLVGLTLAEAEAALPDLIAALPEQFPQLLPADATPTAEPTSSEPTATSDPTPAPTASSSASGSASATAQP